MSSIGSPVNTSLVQIAQAQQTAGKARSSERAATERTRRDTEEIELRVDGVELTNAVRELPQNNSEQAEEEHQARSEQYRKHDDDPPEIPQIDVRA